MLPNLDGRNAFIEITNPEHGGEDWALGLCLWSPVKNKAGQKTWAIMNQIRIGDFIIHLVKYQNEYFWHGFSTADSNLFITDTSPELPGRWENMSPYQRVNLSNYVRLSYEFPIEKFFKRYDARLRTLAAVDRRGRFYNLYRGKELRIAERYTANCSKGLYKLFQDLSVRIEFDPMLADEEKVPTVNEPSFPDYTQPPRVLTMISRIIRDTALGRSIKKKNKWRCNICGVKISLPNGEYYIEAHHLHPLGGDFNGPDTEQNIIILCPTHHAEFDYGSIAISLETGLIEHIDSNNPFNGKNPSNLNRNVGKKFLKFHYDVRFSPNRT